MKYLLLFVLCWGMSLSVFANKVYTPNTAGAITGSATYCQNVTPAVLSFTYNTCNAGTGATSGTPLTIEWYSNSVNSTVGGTLESTTFVSSAVTATGTISFLPSTVNAGVTYYYCVISWTGAGTCNTTGSLTSPVTSVTVNTAPDAIDGTLSACVGTQTTLSNTVGGGVWSSATAAKATISASGVVSAVAAGTSVISYSIGSCRSTATFTVLATPVAITGTNTICQGAVTTFADVTAGGTWSTADATVASINASSPVSITGLNNGATTITYTLPSTGCYATRPITVNITPAAITGSTSSCVGVQTTLSSATVGGTWASGTVAKATITASGVVSAVSAGTSVISYTLGTCRSTATFTVLATPAAITGTNTICAGAITTFTDATAGGTWSTANASIASINASSPVSITGINDGATTISYTLPATGCYATRPITVNVSPAAIVGASGTCLGTSTTLTNIVGGGTWTSSAPTKATISASGVVTALTAGAATISYTIGSCRSTFAFTALANPAAITGTNTVCEGLVTTFTDATAGGTWSTDNASVASINASSPVGITGVMAGSANITYTLGTSCYATRAVTVNTTPAAITGTTSSCVGVQTTLSDATPGGTWTSATVAKTTITASGVVSAVSAGTSLISYTLGTCRATTLFTVLATPVAITGNNTICEGVVTTFTDATAGGTWSTDDASIASIDASSPVTITGVNDGATTISYTLASTGCSATRGITVNTSPAAITGTTTACIGTSVTLTNSVPGGTWVSSVPTRATVSATGVVTALAAGTTVISYTLGSCRSTVTFTVNANPAAITGTNIVCQGLVTTFTDVTAGGTWSTSDASIASINSSSPVGITGVMAGTSTISYTLPTGCFATRAVTVNANPAPITGASFACVGSHVTLSNATTGGVWSSSVPARASVNASTGVVTAASGGVAIITYTVNSCRDTFSFNVASSAGVIAGVSSVCEGAMITLTNPSLGGTWSSSNTATASIDATSGIVTGISSGAVTISYTNGCGAPAMKPITVNTTPAAISGPSAVCEGSTISLSDINTGGSWASTNTSVATIDATTGVVTGTVAGATTISYTLSTGCYITSGVTVNPTPATISGASFVCVGATATLTNAIAGGTWTSSDNSLATIDAVSGVVTGVDAGTVIITYALGSCFTTYSLPVNTVPSMPAAITGSPTTFCTGTVVTLSDVTPAGTWSSSNPAAATINTDGVVAGLTAGASTISYSFTNICGTTAATKVVNVVNYPSAAITSADNACLNYATTIVFSGTPDDTITYSVDGGANMLQVLAGGTFSLNTGIVVSNHSYKLVEVHNATCATAIDTTVNISPIPMQWVGGAVGHETEWERGANWSCGFVPGDTTDVIIPAGTTYSPVVGASLTVRARNLNIASGATVTGSLGSFLYVKNTITNNGTYNGAGNLGMNGTSAQAISGLGKVSNFQLLNASGASISTGSRMIITGTLNLTSGTLTTHDSLVLNSDSVYTARVGTISFGAGISGNVKVLQYIPGGYRRYRFWSHPFSTSISMSQIQKYIDITGAGGSANGFTTTGSNNPSAFRYNPFMGNSASSYDPGWVPFTKINALAADSNLLHKYQGIRLFMRGSKGQGLGYVLDNPNPVTIAMVGPLNQGDQEVVLSKGSAANQDYNMIGNPFPSPVDLGTVAYNAKAAGQIVGTAFYLWNQYRGVAGGFVTVNIGTSAPVPYFMQANTCFQIRAAHNGDIMTFSENNKGATPDTIVLKSSRETVALNIYDANYHLFDNLDINFNKAATTKEDNDYDAQKLMGADFNFYSISADDQKLAIDGRPYSEEVVPLGLNTIYNQDYIIKAENVVLPDGGTVFLHDKLLNKYVEMTQGAEYKFSVDKNVETQGNQRFELSMKPAGAAANVAMQVALSPNPATNEVNITYHATKGQDVSIKITDVTGVNVYNKNLGTTQSGTVKVDLNKLSAGLYMVEVSCGNEKAVHKLVKE